MITYSGEFGIQMNSVRSWLHCPQLMTHKMLWRLVQVRNALIIYEYVGIFLPSAIDHICMAVLAAVAPIALYVMEHVVPSFLLLLEGWLFPL